MAVCVMEGRVGGLSRCPKRTSERYHTVFLFFLLVYLISILRHHHHSSLYY